MTEHNLPSDNSEKSADPTLTRQEFIRRVVKGAALTGALLSAPQILDKFLVPKAYAAASLACTTGTFTGAGNQDQVIAAGASILCISGSGAGNSTACSGNADATLTCP